MLSVFHLFTHLVIITLHALFFTNCGIDISYLPVLKQLVKPYKSLCALVLRSKNFLLETPRHPLSLKRLAQELLIRKWDDVKTKYNCWTGKLITIYTINLTPSRVTKCTDIDNGLTHIPKLFYRKQTPSR